MNAQKFIGGLLGISSLLLLPIFLANDYFVDIAILSGVYIVLALGLNLVVGFTGLLALGYAAFYGIGAYVMAILGTAYGISFWLALPLAFVITSLCGLLLSAPALRLRGDYLAIVTLGFGEIINQVFTNWVELTRGPMGIPGIQSPALAGIDFGKFSLQWGDRVFPSNTLFYYLVGLLVALVFLVCHRLSDSRLGRAWMAIREDEVAAEAMGINTFRVKWLAFALSAGIAGIAGCFFASYTTFIGPTSFTFLESVLILSMVVLGGRGNLWGVVGGAALLILLPEMLRGLVEYRMLLFGALLVGVMLFRPQGLWGKRE